MIRGQLKVLPHILDVLFGGKQYAFLNIVAGSLIFI